MTNCFTEQIFGQFVEVEREPFKNVLLSKNTQKNSLLHSISSEKHFKLNNCFEPEVLFPECSENSKQEEEHDLDMKMSSEKEFSCPSTSMGNSQTAKAFHELKNIFASQTFPCGSCENGETKNRLCSTCSGTGIIQGSSKLVKLMSYIMDFKCGLIPSYKQEQKQKKETDMRFKSEVVPKSTPNWRTHEGYKCNGCQMEPIVGVRYHCPHPCCNDDYDLCENCFCKLNHPHELEEFGYNLMQEKLENMKAKMFKPCNGGSLSNKNACFWFGERNKQF